MDFFSNLSESLEKENKELTEDEHSFECQNTSSLESIGILESKDMLCKLCGFGQLLKPDSKGATQLTIYTRQGTKTVLHQEKRCNNYRCRTGHYYGFHRAKKGKVFDENVLQNDYLITSSQTAFKIAYLWDKALQVHFSQASFESLSNIYNCLHLVNLPYDTLKKRENIYRKRITEAYKTFIFLDLLQRYVVANPTIDNLNDTILEHMSFLKEMFRYVWSSQHECEKAGCPNVLIIDGGCKPHR